MIFLQQLYNALAVGAIYVAVALGITLIYGLTRIVNFAHGQLLVLGSFLTFALVSNGIPFFISLAVSVVAVSLIGEILDLALFRRTLQNPLNGFVISLGLIVALQSVVVLVWGQDQQRVEPPFDGVFRVAGIAIDQPRLLLLGCTIVAVVTLFLMLHRTRAGRGIRALAEDPTAARLVGVPVSPYISLTFVLGSALAAMAGGLLAATFPFDAYSGFEFVLKGFAVAIIGGLGSVAGAVVAALVLSLAETIGAAYFSIEWAPAFGLIATALIILVRPTGLFRGAGSVGTSHFRLGLLEAKVHARETILRRTASVKRKWRRGLTTRGAWFAAVAILVVLPLALTTARSLSVATHMVILSIAGYAFWFPFRNAGVFSLASGPVIGVGGYAAAVALTRWDVGFWPQVVVAVVVASMVALVMGLVTLRTSTSYFVILTLVLGQLLILVFSNWQSVTRGQFGIVATRPPDPLDALPFDTSRGFYYLVLAFLALTIAAFAWVSRTRYGKRLVALRENEMLARSLGVNAFRDKLIAFVLFGAFSGLAGVLLFHYLRYIQPETFAVHLTIEVILIVLLGGASVWLGPLVGAALVSFLPEVLNLNPVQSELTYGLVLIAVITLMPTGICGMVKRLYVGALWRSHVTTQREPGDAPPRPPGSSTSLSTAKVSE